LWPEFHPVDQESDAKGLRETAIHFFQNKPYMLDVKVSRIMLVIISFLFIHIIMQYSLIWLCVIVGFFYPTYITAKLLKLKNDETEEEGKFWLKYWIVYGTLYSFENLFIDFLSIIPYYSLLKLVCLIWLMHPLTQGASRLYEKVHRSVLKANESKIDDSLQRLQRFHSQQFIRETFQNIGSQAVKRAASLIIDS